jgi:hypothetical protein
MIFWLAQLKEYKTETLKSGQSVAEMQAFRKKAQDESRRCDEDSYNQLKQFESRLSLSTSRVVGFASAPSHSPSGGRVPLPSSSVMPLVAKDEGGVCQRCTVKDLALVKDPLFTGRGVNHSRVDRNGNVQFASAGSVLADPPPIPPPQTQKHEMNLCAIHVGAGQGGGTLKTLVQALNVMCHQEAASYTQTHTPNLFRWQVLMCIYVCMFVCMYVWMDVWMYVCMYVCVCVCVCAFM